jgi:AcrR family transcriptional regulator
MRTKEFDPDLVLGRALDAFWERGYEKTSMQDLVDRMGIGRRSLYDTFGDKHSLFLRALRRYADERTAEQLDLIERATDAREGLRALLESSVVGGSVRRDTTLLINNAGLSTRGRLVDGDIADIRREMAIHFFGSLDVIRAFARSYRTQWSAPRP